MERTSALGGESEGPNPSPVSDSHLLCDLGQAFPPLWALDSTKFKDLPTLPASSLAPALCKPSECKSVSRYLLVDY